MATTITIIAGTEMHVVIGLLLIALLLLGCRVLWYAAVLIKPQVRQLKEAQLAERHTIVAGLLLKKAGLGPERINSWGPPQ